MIKIKTDILKKILEISKNFQNDICIVVNNETLSLNAIDTANAMLIDMTIESGVTSDEVSNLYIDINDFFPILKKYKGEYVDIESDEKRFICNLGKIRYVTPNFVLHYKQKKLNLDLAARITIPSSELINIISILDKFVNLELDKNIITISSHNDTKQLSMDIIGESDYNSIEKVTLLGEYLKSMIPVAELSDTVEILMQSDMPMKFIINNNGWNVSIIIAPIIGQ